MKEKDLDKSVAELEKLIKALETRLAHVGRRVSLLERQNTSLKSALHQANLNIAALSRRH